jgi:hypothetical protein
VLAGHSQFAGAFGRVFELKSGSRCIHVFVQEKVEPDGKIAGSNFAFIVRHKAPIFSLAAMPNFKICEPTEQSL